MGTKIADHQCRFIGELFSFRLRFPNQQFMITTTFETKLFRVQIVGKSAWVESSEGSRWIFRTQYGLPIEISALERGADRPTALLRSAVDHFERTRNGDTTLRDALTSRRVAADPKISTPPKPATAPACSNQQPPKAGLPTKVSKFAHFRTPLRPPLAAH